jgi:hypothetical protein
MTVLRTTSVFFGIVALALVATPAARSDTDGTGGPNAWHSTVAVVTNVVPITSAFVHDRCITGYILCKLSFAGLSLLSATEQVVLGGDTRGARATLGRGFGGDWVVKPSDVASGRKPDVYPDAEQADDADPYLPPI